MLTVISKIRSVLPIAFREFQLTMTALGGLRGLSTQQALALFRKDPLRWFCNHGRPHVWPQVADGQVLIYPLDVTIAVGGVTIGWIERITVDIAQKVARVQHIAVSKDLEGQGLGYVIAHALRLSLVANYKVSTILFAEDSRRYDEADYPGFFARLGASSEPGDFGSTRPNWRWK